MIGRWIKERYRTMRGYKRTVPVDAGTIRNVITLTAHLGVRSGNYDMTALFA